MTIQFKDGVLHCSGVLAVDDAEALLTQLAGHEQAGIDLSACEHVHSACLQVLMAAQCDITGWPQSATLADWLRAALAASPIINHQPTTHQEH